MRPVPAGLRPDDESAATALAGRGGAHPDVVERLHAVAPSGASGLGSDPSVVVHPNGRVFAFATGTDWLVLRLGAEPGVAVGAIQGVRWTAGDGSWWRCSAWLTDIPTREGLARLGSAMAAAFEVTGTAP